MNLKRVEYREFPCTKKCLVYSCCQRVCWPYRYYVQDVYQQVKYECFEIDPPPPKQIQELAILMNQVANEIWGVQYTTQSDLLTISHRDLELLVSVISNVRKRKDILSYHSFPEELKWQR